MTLLDNGKDDYVESNHSAIKRSPCVQCLCIKGSVNTLMVVAVGLTNKGTIFL